MAAITPTAILNGSANFRRPIANAVDEGKPRFKVGYITTAATADAADTVAVDVYNKFGITKVLAVQEFVHTTTDSVVAEETIATTAVTGTTLTVTIPAGSDNDKRFIVVYGI